MREFFMKTNRIGFSKWNDSDLNLATQLWGTKKLLGLFVLPAYLQNEISFTAWKRKFKITDCFIYSTGLFLSFRQRT